MHAIEATLGKSDRPATDVRQTRATDAAHNSPGHEAGVRERHAHAHFACGQTLANFCKVCTIKLSHSSGSLHEVRQKSCRVNPCQGGQWFNLDWILSFFISLDDQIARISRMKASIFFVIRARSGPRFCSRQIPLKNVTIKPARESLSSRDPRAAARLSMSS